MKKHHAGVFYLGISVAILLLCVLSSQAQEPAVSHRRDIAGLVDEAATIVHGTIISTTIEPDPNLPNLNTVLVRMNVHEALKGSPGKTFTFRQYVWDVRAMTNAAGYRKGQEMLLFLRPPSRYGLTSPAGLQQGQFMVSRDLAGRAMAVNGLGNVGLLQNVSLRARARGVVLPGVAAKMSTQRTGAVDLDGLKQIVRAFAGANR
jgi:hypothetical protein